jgi:hypothetical protein
MPKGSADESLRSKTEGAPDLHSFVGGFDPLGVFLDTLP